MRGGYKNQRVCCEAFTRGSVRDKTFVKCKAKGYFTPTSRKFLCMYHGGINSYDFYTRKYKGLFKNPRITLENKIKRLKNLKNFKDKTDEQIKEYIFSEEKRSNTVGYRTKYFVKQLNRWKLTFGRGFTLKDKIKNFIRLSGLKPKV